MITILTSLKNNTHNTLLLEIIDTKSIDFYKKLGFPDNILSHLSENLKRKKDKEVSMIFYGKFFGGKKIIAFFPKKDSLMDERCDNLTKIEKDVIFIPSREFSTAYEAMVLSTYSYEKFLTKKTKRSYSIYIPDEYRKTIESQKPLLDAIIRARDIINLPPFDKNPEKFIEYIKKFPWKRFKLRIIDAKELKKLGCNLILAVGSGSDYPPYMVILERIVSKNSDTYAFIGKGVTFDAGGLQIKPDTGMFDMKCDMSGAAGLLGVAEYLDTVENLPVNIIVGLGITENVINGKAFKPLDIYRSYTGKTVEIHHTDAEGRLVLADVMGYIEDIYKPKHILTLATLTGACIYALGNDIAGIMGDDEKVIQSLIQANSPYEKLWRLPLNEKLKKSLKAEIADIKNVAKSEKAGSSIGGAFLSYFQGKAKLTHIDIAGPAYRDSPWGYMPKGGTGWGVKILSEYIISLGRGKKGK